MEALGNVTPSDVGVINKTEFICACGARRFKWIATYGMIKAGGFRPDEYVYQCLGCGREHSSAAVKAFFK
jgi:hypothetical protein